MALGRQWAAPPMACNKERQPSIGLLSIIEQKLPAPAGSKCRSKSVSGLNRSAEQVVDTVGFLGGESGLQRHLRLQRGCLRLTHALPGFLLCLPWKGALPSILPLHCPTPKSKEMELEGREQKGKKTAGGERRVDP